MTTIKIDKSKKLWCVIAFALFIAFLLIVFSFIGICFRKEKISQKSIFDIKSYEAVYLLTVFSNKNQNAYKIHEWCKYEKGGECFRFDFENETKDKVTYILKDNFLSISNNNEKNTLEDCEYSILKENFISISTFLDMYKKIEKNEFGDYLRCENIKEDNKNYFVITVSDKNYDNNSIMQKSGLKIQKIELITENGNIPIEYYIYGKNNDLLIGIKYSKFDILDKIDEKIFANFNK